MQHRHSATIDFRNRSDSQEQVSACGSAAADRAFAPVGASLRADHEVTEKKRLYKREYMRRWRGDPAHQELERARRRSDSGERKLRKFAHDDLVLKRSGVPVCGICHARRSVTEVTRLRISEDAPYSYVAMRLPYCGQC